MGIPSTHAFGQVSEPEWSSEIVIGSCFETTQHVCVGCQRRRRDYLHRGDFRIWSLPKTTKDLESGHVRHLDIKDHHCRAFLLRKPECLWSG